MTKLISSMLAAAGLVAGASAFAQGAEGQAGSAWRDNGQYNGAAPITQENSSGHPAAVYWYNGRAYPYPPHVAAAPAYPYYGETSRREREREAGRVAARRDRDGDGVRNSRDRYPDDPSRF